MPLRNFILGVTFTTVLLLGVGLTRLMKVEEKEETWVLQKVEALSLTPPPAPPLEELPEVTEELEAAAPPSPSFDDVPQLLDSPSLTVPMATVSVSLNQEVDLFSENIEPVELAPVQVAKVKKVGKPKLRKPKSTNPAVKSVTHSSVSLGELDAKPRLLRKGRFRWPQNVRDKEVKATVYVELNAQGRVKLLEVKSLSAPKFRSTLEKFIRSSRFSAPKVGGKPVNNVRYNWPITLKKP